MKTLLEKAREHKVRKFKKNIISDEHIDLLIAWANGEITSRQVSVAIGKSDDSGMHLYSLAVILRDAIKLNKIKIIKNKCIK